MNRILHALLLLATIRRVLAASAETQILGVREGVSEQMSPSKLHDRYKGFAEFIGRIMGKPTSVDASQEGKYAVMFVRPVGLVGRAIRGTISRWWHRLPIRYTLPRSCLRIRRCNG